MAADPEGERVAELAALIREGRASDAEREELALYHESDPSSRALAVRAERDRELGGTWLARAEADRRLQSQETTKLAKAERSIGAALATAGFIGAFFVPTAGLVMAAGIGLLGFSILRVKLTSSTKDPYADIEK